MSPSGVCSSERQAHRRQAGMYGMPSLLEGCCIKRHRIIEIWEVGVVV